MTDADKDRRVTIVLAVLVVLVTTGGDLAVSFYAALGCGIGENNSPAFHDALCGQYTWVPLIGAAVMAVLAIASRARDRVFLLGVVIGASAALYPFVAGSL